MTALHHSYLEDLETYFSSGAFTEDFHNSPEERRYEMLEFMEKLMDVAELADATVTKIIFRNAEKE